MQNSMMLFIFFVFYRKRPSWANLVQIVNIYSFFCFRSEVLCWENLVQNVKIASLRLNLLASLIQIYRIQKRYSLFSFSIENAFFLVIVVQNVKIVGLKANFIGQSNSNIHNSMMLFTFLFSTGNTLFGEIWSKKSKLLV